VIETLLVLGAVLGLAAAGLLATLVPIDVLLQLGGVITTVGLLIGVPTGFWYHVALYRTLRARGPLPSRWWLHPVPLHERLEERERDAVLLWFVAGGLGFGVVVIGCSVIVLALLATLTASG